MTTDPTPAATARDRDAITEAVQRNDFLHTLDIALASNGYPDLPVVGILRDMEEQGYTYRLTERALALAAAEAPGRVAALEAVAAAAATFIRRWDDLAANIIGTAMSDRMTAAGEYLLDRFFNDSTVEEDIRAIEAEAAARDVDEALRGPR